MLNPFFDLAKMAWDIIYRGGDGDGGQVAIALMHPAQLSAFRQNEGIAKLCPWGKHMESQPSHFFFYSTLHPALRRPFRHQAMQCGHHNLWLIALGFVSHLRLRIPSLLLREFKSASHGLS